MISARHHRFITGRLDGLDYSLVIGRHDCTRHVASSERTLYNPANHWLSGDFQQSFARQTNRIVACGDYCDNICFGIRRRF
jgi:hypothetical protein